MFLSFIPVFSPGYSLSLRIYTHFLPCHKYQLTFPHRRWIARVGKAEALANAGVMLPPSGSDDVKDVPEAIQKGQGAVKIVAFNVVSVVPLIQFFGLDGYVLLDNGKRFAYVLSLVLAPHRSAH